MNCQFCEKLATVHVTDITKSKKRELHMCESCARKHNLVPDQPTPHVDLKALLNLLPLVVGQLTSDPAALTCPTCGLQYGEFRAGGRLGCPADYDAFETALVPLIERIHRSVVHTGKIPKAVRRQLRETDIRNLREQLSAAITAERYEDAARLRDLIRQKEATDEPR